MTAAMNPEAVAHLGFWFALMPIAVGTSVLVVFAALYARLTGRHYPFRQFEEVNRHGTHDPDPMVRLGLTERELSGILERYRQSFNLGVEDLARLIGAAELQAASHRTEPARASDIMSRNLVTVDPATSLEKVAKLFKTHRFTSLPVVEPDGRFLGVIFQIHLIAGTWTGEVRRGVFRNASRSLRAGDIMTEHVPPVMPTTPISALLPMMADGDVDAVPVLDKGKIVGIVTRTDFITALARKSIYEF